MDVKSVILPIFVNVTLLGFWLFAGAGCGSPPSEIIKLRQTIGLSKPYKNFFSTRQSPDQVLEALTELLHENDAVITAVDKQKRFLAWCEPGGTFHPLAVTESPHTGEDTEESLLLRPLQRFHGIVYAAARLKAHRNGTILGLHASRRDERPWIISYSNGDYERGVYRRLVALLAQQKEQ